MKILLVEDDKHLVFLMPAMLKRQDPAISIHTVSRGDDAVKAVIREDWSVILMDLRLPFMGGLEATKRIRELSTVPIVAVTAYGDKKTRIEAQQAGVDELIEKPVIDHLRFYTRLRRIIKDKKRSTNSLAAPGLIEAHRARLYLLQRRKAVQGINTDPAVDLEIESIEREIERLQTNLS